jgi:hypothetical protein
MAPQPLLDIQTPCPHPALASFTTTADGEAPTGAGAGRPPPPTPQGLEEEAAAEDDMLQEELLLLLPGPDGPPCADQHYSGEAGRSPAAAATTTEGYQAAGILERVASSKPEALPDLASESCLRLPDVDSESCASGEKSDPESGDWARSASAARVSTDPAAWQSIDQGGAPGGWAPPPPTGEAGRTPSDGSWAGRFEMVVDEAAAAAAAFRDPFHDDWEHWK